MKASRRRPAPRVKGVRMKASRRRPALALEQIVVALPQIEEVADCIKYVDVH